MKKTQRLVTLLLMLCLMLNYSMLANAAELPPNTNENANAYSNDWVYWCQGASKYWGMRGYGCRMVAQSKLLVEAGVVQAGSFNPDVYFEWCKSNGYIDGKTMCELKCGQGPGAYARTLQKNLTYSKQVSLYGSKADRAAQIMSYLNNGYYVILGSAAHHAYVGRSASLRAGTPVIYDSWSGYSYNTATVQNYTSYTLVNFSYMWLFSTDEVAPPPPPSVHVVTGNVDTITETSAILRGSFTTTGGRATECGMYLGTSEGNVTKLGSDKVNTYGTSMFYSTAKYGRTLEPGTTYYYQAYAIVGEKEYRGNVKSFRTEGIQPSISITARSFCIKDDREPAQLTSNTEPYGASVTWSSSDNNVVYVYESTGKIVGVAPGTATITAEMVYNGKSYYASCDITVLPREGNPDITLNTENVNIEEKTYTLLIATTTPNGETVKWESSNSSVAIVDDAGFVSGVSAGTATISASFEYNGHIYTAYCAVTVEPVQDNSLKAPVLSLSSSQIKEGESFTAYWTEAAADASYYIDYSGRTAGGSTEFGMSGSTKSLSMSTGSFWSAGTYTLCIVASNSTGSVRSNEVELIIQEKDNTKPGIVVNTNGQYLAINDRAAASPKYSNQIGRIPPAGVVTVYPDKTIGNWYYVEYNGVSGYAYSKYLSLQ